MATKKTTTQILAQFRKDVRASMRGLFALKNAGALDLLPERFEPKIYVAQAMLIIENRAKKPSNALTKVGKQLAREEKIFTPENIAKLHANKIETEAWEHAISGKKLKNKDYAAAYLWTEWNRKHGRPPSLREMRTTDYDGRLKTIQNRLSEVSKKSQNGK